MCIRDRIFSVALAELALVFFGLLPQPFNVFALFFNGLALGCMWGVIFSFIEGDVYKRQSVNCVMKVFYGNGDFSRKLPLRGGTHSMAFP